MAGFKKAARKALPFKGSIQGPSGSGKTYSALKIMTALVGITNPGKRIAVIDTEKAAEGYAPPFDFDVDGDFGQGVNLSYGYKKLIEKLETARKAGEYGGVIIDSMTHFWKEVGGFTRMIDAICEAQRGRGQKADSFAAWKQVDPLYRELMTYIRQYPLHVIMCMRAKQAYEDVVENGKKKKIKVGMEPEFREAFEYELDAQFAITDTGEGHVLVPLKHRLEDALDGKAFRNPGQDVAQIMADWCNSGAHTAPPVAAAEPPPVEEPSPDTEQQPPVVNDETALADEFLAAFQAASDVPELEALRPRVKEAVDTKKLNSEGENYRRVTRGYKARKDELQKVAA